MKYRNAIGPQIQRLRNKRKWTQEILAAKLQLLGLNISRQVIANIELGTRGIEDYWLYYFARLFGVNFSDLFPPIHPHSRDMHKSLTRFMNQRF